LSLKSSALPNLVSNLLTEPDSMGKTFAPLLTSFSISGITLSMVQKEPVSPNPI